MKNIFLLIAVCSTLLSTAQNPCDTINVNIAQNDTSICFGDSISLSVGNTNSSNACVLPTNLQNGLVAYYPFCGNANDDSGNGNNGTVNGATLSVDRFGNSNSAYSFDGVDDWIDVPNANENDLSNSLTLAVWVKTTNNHTNAGIVGKWNDFDGNHNDGQEQYILQAAGSGIYFWTKTSIVTSCNETNIEYNNGQWHHYVGTWDGNMMHLYRDGLLLNSSSQTGSIVNFMQNVEFGRYAGGMDTSNYFNGMIDDIFIYNRDLDSTEIQQLYNSQNNYSWSTGETTENITVSPTQTTTYYLTQTQNGVSCSDSVTVTVNLLGCTDSTSFNYDPQAACDDGSCISFVYGCTDSLAVNYNPIANIDDNTCVLCSYMDNDYIEDVFISNVTCYGGVDASIYGIYLGNQILDNGNGPYMYSVDSGLTFQHSTAFNDLSAGNYYITYMDSIGCINPNAGMFWMQISEPDAFAYNATANDVSCSGGVDGSINLSVVSGNTSPYYIDWSNGTIGNNNTNLSNGTYQAYVSDVNGCQDTLTYFILHPLPIVSVINTNDVSCVGGADGSASISSSGGTPPFTYLWSDGQIGNTATNLSESSYEVFVTDSANCLDTAYFSIGSNPINISISTTNVTCNGNDGAADASVSGGAAPYSYIWYFEYPGFGYVTAYFQEDISNVPSGTYYVEVTDANGCTSNSDTITLIMDDVVINALVTDVSCNGGADGSIDVTTTGGLLPYTYSWSDGSITEDIINITTGNNTITVTDGNGCSITESYAVNEPTPLSVSAISNPVTTACDGSIDVSVSGGTPAYSFAWQLPASAITDSFTVTTASTTSAHPYFSYGPFQVYEIDGVQGAELTLIRGETYYFTMDNVLFFHPFYLSTDMFGGQSGSFVGQVTTGVSNLDAVGTYSATNNQTIAFTPNSSHADTLYYQCGNHMYMGYRLIITDGITSEDLTDLCEGNYDLTVTDANGCSDNYSYIIGSTIYGCTDSTAINFDLTANTDDGSCIAFVYGCTDSTQFNYNVLANTDDGSCISFVYGCMDSNCM